MIEITRKSRNRLCSTLLISVLTSASFFFSAGEGMATETNKSDPLWVALNQISSKRLVPLAAIGAAFPGQYQVVEDSPYSTFYGARDVVLSPDRGIANVDLRISKENPRTGLVILSVTGSCIPFSRVRSMYPSVVPVPPSPHNTDQEQVFSSEAEHGRLRFGHEIAGRSCLKWIRYDFEVEE